MKKTVAIIMHIALLLVILFECSMKFVWFYDYSLLDDFIQIILMIGITILELLIFSKLRIPKNDKAILSVVFMIMSGCSAVMLIVLPFIWGNPDFNYIICYMVVPISLLVVRQGAVLFL